MNRIYLLAVTNTARPLDGIRVLAVEQMIAAPWATQMLGRLGAEVIKIEHPVTGDSGRGSAPRVTASDGRAVGATYLRSNLNKRSVGIDLKRGADLVLDLAEHCDVFVQNYKAGSLERMGLGYDAVRARNPAIVYASISGFGSSDSPYRSWPAYASVAEAMSGIYEWARLPGQRPVISPVGGLGDISTAMFATIGILAALRTRDHTGQGQHVDVAMFDAMVSMADVVPSLWSLGARERIPANIMTTFTASDGDFVVQVAREHQFARLVALIGRPEWAEDPRFADRQSWVDLMESDLRPAVESWSRTRTKLEACVDLAAAGIASGPCNNAEDVLSDEHLKLHNMLIEFDAGEGQTYVVPGNPVKFSGRPEYPDTAAPLLGEGTDSVLGGLLGLEPERLARLRADGILG
jgi:crotonobetainyl-CoA:carnitine CoA-transferase CaiB-like acyl-CoA transferase